MRIPGFSTLGVFLTFLLLCLPGASAHSIGNTLTASGTATVDGMISPGEYASCIGPIGQGGYLFKICETNDLTNDYYAVMIDDLTHNPNDVAVIHFDDDNNGAVVHCGPSNAPPPEEDLIVAFGAGSPPQPGPDGHYCYTGTGLWTTNGEPSMNGGDIVKFTAGTGYVYEWWHPLSSGDSQDYSIVSPGGTVGWCFSYLDRGMEMDTPLQYPVGCYAAARNGDASKYGDVVNVGPIPEFPSAIPEVLLAISMVFGYFMTRRRRAVIG